MMYWPDSSLDMRTNLIFLLTRHFIYLHILKARHLFQICPFFLYRYHQESSVAYPTVDSMVNYVELHREPQVSSKKSPSEIKVALEAVRQQAESDPLHEMHEQDMKELWAMRYEALDMVPSLLPKLLDSVEWSDHKQVSRRHRQITKTESVTQR